MNTLEELQRERAEIEQRFGELKKVKDLLTPDAYQNQKMQMPPPPSPLEVHGIK